MLTLALAATLIGFGLLVVALITGNFWLAVACIVVCVIGLLVLLVDTVRSSRRGAGTGDEPLFTIRDRTSAERAAPLHDDDGEPSGRPADSGATAIGRAESGAAPSDTAVSARTTDSGPQPQRGGAAAVAPASGGLGSLVARGAGTPAAPPAEAPASGPQPAVPASDSEVVTGDANDYVKSVTGSFPIQRPPSAPWPTSPNPVPAAHSGEAPGAPGTAATPSVDGPHAPSRGPDTGPLPAASPYVGRRRRAADEADGQEETAAATPTTPTAPASPVSPPSTAFRPAGPAPAAWTRQNEQPPTAQTGGDGLVVHDHTGPLPKMTFKNEEE